MVSRFRTFAIAFAAVAGFACAGGARGLAQAPVGWLRYAIPPDPPRYHDLPHAVVLLGDGSGHATVEEETAAEELDRGLGHMVAGTDTLLRRFDPRLDAIVVGTTEALRRSRLGRSVPGWMERPLPEEGFRIVHLRRGPRQWWVLQGGSARAEMYAAFRFAALVAEDQQLPEELVETPKFGLRAVALRGDLAGLPVPAESRGDLPALALLARLMASVGLNGLVLDAAPEAQIRSAAERVRPWGIRVWARVGGFPTGFADLPLNGGGAAVQAPFGGDAAALREAMERANGLARTLRRHGGSVLLEDALGEPLRSAGAEGRMSPEQRAEVLRGGLEPNVVLTGEATSRLLPAGGPGSGNFGLLPGAAQAAVFELLPGAAGDAVFPVSAWERVLQTPEKGKGGETTLSGVLAGSGGLMAQTRVADVNRLLDQPLDGANLFGFGRVAWDPARDVSGIAEGWARQSWGNDARVFGVAKAIAVDSLAAYTSSHAALGLPGLAGGGGRPDPARAGARVGAAATLPLADRKGVGVDRTVRGTGELARYPAGFAAELSDPRRCPEDWLLAVQRVSVDATLGGEKTAVQAFYDAHFTGASQAANLADAWEAMKPLVDAERYTAVHDLLEASARRAELWRDVSTEWMQRVTGVADATGFVGNHPGRVEAEAMGLKGFTAAKTGEPEDASGGAVISCRGDACEAGTEFRGEANVYRVEVGAFPAAEGGALTVRVNGRVQAEWTRETAGNFNTERFVVNGVRLKPGDRIAVSAGRGSVVDFVEVTRDPRWN